MQTLFLFVDNGLDVQSRKYGFRENTDLIRNVKLTE